MIVLHGASPRLQFSQKFTTDKTAGSSGQFGVKPFIVKISLCYYHIIFKI